MTITAFGQNILNQNPLFSQDGRFNSSTTLADGRTAVATSEGSFPAVVKIHSASGEPLQTIPLGSNAGGIGSPWDVIGLADGGFVVSGSTTSNGGGGAFQIFNADGTERTNGIVNVFGFQQYGGFFQTHNQVIALPNGGFMMAWNHTVGATTISPLITPNNGQPSGSANTQIDIHSRIFDSSGNALGTELLVTQGTIGLPTYSYNSQAGYQALSDLDVLSNGNVVVTYAGARYDLGANPYIYSNFRVLDGTSNTLLVGETPYSQDVIGTGYSQQAYGPFQTVVLSNGQLAGLYGKGDAGLYSDIKLQLMTAGGTPIGSVVDLQLDYPNNALLSALSFSAQPTNDDGFLVIYDDFGDAPTNSNVDLFMRRYNTNGVAQETVQITNAAGPDYLRSFERGPDGSYIVTWWNSSNGGTLIQQRFVYTQAGQLVQTGDGSSNTITLGAGDDRADGEAGNDTISGAGGIDRLYGDAGADTLNGDAGNDILDGGTGNDTINGGADSDTADYGGTHAAYLTYTKTVGGIVTTTIKDGVGNYGTDTVTNVETLHFSDGNVTRFGAQQNLTMNVDGARFDDVVYRSVSTGQIIYQNMNNGAAAGFDAVTNPLPGWTAIGTGDVSGDGKADVIIWNSASGFVYSALPGASASPTYGLLAGGINGTYAALGVTDINGDGVTDLLVREANTGSIFWENPTNSVWAYVGINLGSNWNYQAAGDVNRDGFSDVVIRDTSGLVYIASMANGVNSGYTSLGNLTGYQVRTVADVNADGYADVIVQRESDGWTLWRDLSGGTLWNVATNPVGTSWIVKDAADVDNDGSADLIFQHSTTGETLYRAMDNGVGTSWQSVSSPLGTDYVVV